MLSIEKKIAPLVQSQFPSFYQEEGQLFIAFMKAYYEWMENYTQLLNLEDVTGFDAGDTVTQADVTGTIISKTNNSILVELNKFAVFRCNINCDTLNPLVSSSGAITTIVSNEDFSPLFWARHLPEIRDIDRTLDRFILRFKNKYLPNIQFTTATNKELFIKNSLDFYRAKGTERAVDLFFKLIYGFEANVYYPGDDLFKPSDNEWVNVRYLEIESADTNVNMVGQIVYGAVSGANAFAERLVRVKKEGRFINVLYITNLNGNFQTGENVFTKDLTNNVTAKIYGSLTTFEILTSDDGFEVGEDLFVEDGAGKRGRGRVRQTQTFIGTVDFDLLEGGWGYTADAEIIGSENVIQLANVNNSNTDYFNLNQTFNQFETVEQYLLQLENSAEEFDFSITDTATVYSGNEIAANGIVVFANTSQIVLNYNPETANSDIFANTDTIDVIENSEGNTYSVNTAIDISVSGEVMGISANSTITYNNNSIRLQEGDVLYQKGIVRGTEIQIANGTVDRTFIEFEPTTNTYFNFISDIGTFRTDRPFYRVSDDEEFQLINISNTNIGIHKKTPLDLDNIDNDTVYTFYAGGELIGVESGVVANVAGVFGFETEAAFIVPNTEFEESFFIENFRNDERINVIEPNTEIGSAVYDQLTYNTELSNTAFGFNDKIGEFTEFSNVNIGSIKAIVETAPGSGYPVDPFFIIYEPSSFHLERYDYLIQYQDDNRNFRIGEVIVGETSGAVARVFFHDPRARILRATRVHLDEINFTSNDFTRGEIVRGTQSNISSVITDAPELRRKPRTGLNADIKATALSGPGFVTELEVLDSGFGYEDGEPLRLRSYVDPTKEVTVIARLGQQGIGQGYHINRKSFLSSDKYIQDSDFYQEYSYEVLTSLPFETYRDTLVKVLHVAGTKPFGSYVSTVEEQIDIKLNSVGEDFDILKEDVFINENIFYQHLLDCYLEGDLQTRNGVTDLETSYCPANVEACELDLLCQVDLEANT